MQNREIKVSELRIGNYFEVDGAIFKTSVITKSNFIGEPVTNSYAMRASGNIRKPITLTSEILEKCGFKEAYPLADYYLKEGFYGEPKFKDCKFILYDYEGNEVLNEPLQYLHQLQNLYFDLTNQELTIDLKELTK